MSAEYVIRPLEAKEVPLALKWAEKEGWEPGTHDFEPFTSVDPEGFLGGFLGGRLVACISAVRYNGAFAFVGFYIVDEPYRGKGYGLRLWRAALARAGDQRVVGLDGVVAQQANYAREGFVTAHKQLRFGGHVPADFEQLLAAGKAVDVRPVDGSNVDAVIAFDARHFPVPRPAFTRAWVLREGRTALTAGSKGEVRGYCASRATTSGAFKLGPVFAQDVATASALMAAALRRLPAGAAIFLDVPAPNAQGVALAERLRLKPVFETARMYRGPAPTLPVNEIFGVTSFELG